MYKGSASKKSGRLAPSNIPNSALVELVGFQPTIVITYGLPKSNPRQPSPLIGVPVKSASAYTVNAITIPTMIPIVRLISNLCGCKGTEKKLYTQIFCFFSFICLLLARAYGGLAPECFLCQLRRMLSGMWFLDLLFKEASLVRNHVGT